MRGIWQYIDTAEGLGSMARDLASSDRVAVDTESDSMYSYFEKVCLVQIATAKRAYVIDPLALGGDLSALSAFFADPDTLKILHGANYDVVCLKRDYEFEIRGVFDTMIAAQHLGLPKIGLADLVSERFDARLDKRHARTNWGRRPLDPAELEYSYRDVKYLIELAGQLDDELEEHDVREEAELEFLRLEELLPTPRAFDQDGYLRIRGSRELRPRELSVLRELYVMRDRRARKMNRPPFKVLANDTLVRLSRARPRRNTDLEGVKGVTRNVLRNLGHRILESVNRGIDRGRPPPPRKKKPKGPRLSPRKQKQVEVLKQWRKQRAEDRGVPTLVVLPNHAVIEVVVEQPGDQGALASLTTVGSKRARLYGEEILDILHDGHRPAR